MLSMLIGSNYNRNAATPNDELLRASLSFIVAELHRRGVALLRRGGAAAFIVPASSLLIHDVLLKTGQSFHEVVFLCLADFEFIERAEQMFDRYVPVGVGDAQTFVNGSHAAPDVKAGAAGRGAELVKDELANPFLRIEADAVKKLAELFVFHQASQKLVGDGGQRVVTAEPFVEAIGLPVRAVGLRLNARSAAAGQQQEAKSQG
jgi:hypothetical protein